MIQLPFRWKPQYTVIALFALSALIIIVVSTGWMSAYKDRAFEKRQQQYQQQLDDLEIERTKALARAEMYEQKTKELESQIAINEAIIKASGARAQIAQKAADDEMQKLQQEFDSIGADVPDDVRAERIRERLKRLYPK